MWYSFIKKSQSFYSDSSDLTSRSNDWFFSNSSNQNLEYDNDQYETIIKDVDQPIVSEDWLENAKSWIGTPYKFGGNSKSGIDCSAFIQQVFTNKNLPRTANEQMKIGSSVPIDNISLWSSGDRIYFDMGPRLGSNNDVADHTGIYIGDNKFIQASSSKGVTISDISPNSFYYNKVIAVRR